MKISTELVNVVLISAFFALLMSLDTVLI